MEETTHVPFYSVFEEVYRHGRSKGKRPVIRHTDVCEDDLPTARALAFGLVAERMQLVKKTQSGGLDFPRAELIAFRAWDVETSSKMKFESTETLAEDIVEKVKTGEDGELWDHFNQGDDVVWKVEITTGENYPEDCFSVYDSERDTDKAIDRLLKEAMFLAKYAWVNVVTTS